MGKIEERAKQYAREMYGYSSGVEIAFIRGAQSERAELTRWRDPKEELPDTNCDVLIKTTSAAKYKIAFYKASSPRNYHWHENNGAIDDDMVLGWRPIED